MILVSGCLSGDNCFYNGDSKVSEPIKKLVEEGRAIAACPEILGGLPVPRKPSEIKGGTGADVLRGQCKVMTRSGIDITAGFLAGARAMLSLARKHNVKKAVLKSRSPACGYGKICDGLFTGKLIKGDGVACAILRVNGVEVISDEEFLESL